MKAKASFIVSLAVGAGLLAFVLNRYGAPALDILGADLSVPMLAGFGAMTAAAIACLSWRWRYLLSGICTAPGIAKLVVFRSAAHSIAVLLPSGKLGGDPLRAWLTARERVTAGRSVAGVAVDRALELASNAPFSMLFALFLLRNRVPELERITITIGVATLGLGLGIFIAGRRLRRVQGLAVPLVRLMRLDRVDFVGRHHDSIAEADRAATQLVRQPRRMLIAFAIGLIANILVIGEFVALLSAFGLPTNMTTVVAAIFATGAAHTIPVPAGVGVLEGANMWLFMMLGYPADVGLAVGLAARLRELIWMLPGVVYLLVRLVIAPSPGLFRAR